jgi:hypothetical protein
MKCDQALAVNWIKTSLYSTEFLNNPSLMKIGEGSFGNVFLLNEDNTEFALKVVKPNNE